MKRRAAIKFIGGTSVAILNPPCRVLVATEPQSTAGDFSAVGKSVAATVQQLASQAAADVFEQGGNAIDAAVCAASVLSVVDGHNSGIGGGCFVLVRRSNGEFLALDGREMAPQLAHRDMFKKNGIVDTAASQTGPLAVGVPGFIAAVHHLHSLLGKLSWSDVLEPAYKLAAEGFAVSPALASAIKSESSNLQRFPASAQIFLKDGGLPLEPGERLIQTDLARTIRALAQYGPDWFYRGEFATLAAQYLADLGGILSQADFARYVVKVRQPIRTSYRGYTVVGFPPPSSGGVHIAQMLMMLERFDLPSLYLQSPTTFYHVVGEAMKLAFADRAYWLGDADFAQVPVGLIDPSYCRQLSQRILVDAVAEVAGHALPNEDLGRFSEKKHTTHLTAADDQGNWVAITSTINTFFGSKIVVPGTGVVLNNQMDDFSIAPGTPNAFGLVGAVRNEIAPGKRPLSSMSPTIVSDSSGTPFLTCGAAGGPRIITATLLNLLRVIDLQQPIDEAIRSPRIHHQWRPNELLFESTMESETVDGLRSLGHSMKSAKVLAIAQGIQAMNAGSLLAASDPRTASKAIAVG